MDPSATPGHTVGETRNDPDQWLKMIPGLNRFQHKRLLPGYIAEFRSGDEKSKAAEEARKAYAEAAEVAKKDLLVTHPIRLGFSA